ncbi:MAG: tRNA lysidine(34) synthetase TilS [Synechococcales cyanobacterium]
MSPRHFVPVVPRVWGEMRRRQLLRRGQRLLVALSGGQDSWCLWHLLQRWQTRMDWQLFALHCNHRWSEDETACAQFMERYFVQHHLVGAVATADPIRWDEAGARRWRYQEYQDWATHWHCDVVVTGHTGSDWAETLLINLCRGTGAAGLHSLAWQRSLTEDIEVVRPLLSVWRSETSAYCHEHQLPVWSDLSNQDRRHTRNRVRLDLIPYLQTHLNPQVEAALVRHATLIADEHDWVAQSAQPLWQQSFFRDPPRLARAPLGNAHVALQRWVLWRFLRQELGTTPGFEQVEWLRHLLSAPRGSRTPPLPGDLWAEVQDQWIVLQPWGQTN